MMQDAHVKLNPGLPWPKQHSIIRRLFYLQIELKFKADTGEMLGMEHSIVWCWNLDTSENRSDIPEKFSNVALEFDEREHFDR
jgi:hypothetical protein